jgi:hypothetical protein
VLFSLAKIRVPEFVKKNLPSRLKKVGEKLTKPFGIRGSR